jgi:hypothetical protein
LLLLAFAATLAIAIAPSSASAFGPNDVLPKPTVTGLPATTYLASASFTVSTTAPSSWSVDLLCGYDTPYMDSCTGMFYPQCTESGGQKTCAYSAVRPISPGTHTYRFAAAYCDLPSLSECENDDGFYLSDTLEVTFIVDRIPPVVTISSGPDKARNQVLKAGSGAFVFAASEAVTFSCSFDDDEEVPCTSPFPVPKYLKNGSHTFKLSGSDVAGNGGVATRSFRVDVFRAKKCTKGKSKSAKAKRKKCVAKNTKDKKSWKKKHGLK